MKSGKSERKKLYFSLAAAAVLIALLFFALRLWETRSADYGGGTDDASDYYYTHFGKRMTLRNAGKEYRLKRNLESFLIIGLDKYDEYAQNENSYRNTQQSDFLMLLVLDKKARSCTALHINRDSMAEIQLLGIGGKPAGSYTAQLALSHTYGSGKEDSAENTVKAVSGLLFDFPIDHYMTLTLDAVPVLNDTVGGVTVTVEDDFSDIDSTLIKGEQVTLFGEHALTFVRSRQGLEDSGNLRRMERQQEYFYALYKTVKDKSETDGDILIECLDAISPYMITDCNVKQLSAILRTAQKYELGEILSTPGEAVIGEEIQGNRFMEFHVDDTELKKILIDNLFEEAK